MKTKILWFIFTVGVIMFSLCRSTFATEAKTTTSTINGTTINWSYELNDSNQIINLKCTNIDALTGNITIPSTLDEKSVISIGSSAFKSSKITGVTIPSSVKSIGYMAFADCANLKKITILDNVTKISDEAFKNHNKDLTIYCYEGSTAAKYAIDNEIKYVYLKREINTNNDNENSNNTTSEKNNNKNNNNLSEVKNEKPSTNNKDGNSSDNNKQNKKEDSSSYNDNTKAPTNLPKTGISMTIIIGILSITLISAISYKKYSNYKSIK